MGLARFLAQSGGNFVALKLFVVLPQNCLDIVSKTYKIDNNYAEWAKQNPCVEHLILKGVLPVEKESDFESAFAEISFKSIDISDFTVEVDGRKYETDYESWWNSFGEPLTAPYKLRKVIANKEFSSSFHWKNGFLLDESETVLIDTVQRDTMDIPQGITIIGHFAICLSDFKTLNLPDSLLTIGRCAFYDSYNFTEVFIPDSVTKIGEYAFDGCDLEKVHLPACLETIPEGCFNLNWLSSIEWPKTLKHIEDEAFKGSCFEKIVLPEGVEDIGYNVFEGRDLHITLPSTLKEIAKDFYYEECVDDPELCLPFVEVHPDNPFFSPRKEHSIKGRMPTPLIWVIPIRFLR